MRITHFDIYRDLIREKSGLNLSQDQSYMLDSRLGPIAKKWGYPTLDAMTVALQGVPDRNLVQDVVVAMTDAETAFFRDEDPFDFFRDVILPLLLKKRAGPNKIKIWSAGCASGQEPFSIALILKEKSVPGWKGDILATDISSEVLEQARHGVYSQFEVQRGLSTRTLLKNFAQKEPGKWKIADDLQKMVRFEQFNLLDDMKKLGAFDVILCRNLISCFDDSLKKSVLEKLAAHLEKDGFLILGRNESAIGATESLKPFPGARGIFVPKNSPHLA